MDSKKVFLTEYFNLYYKNIGKYILDSDKNVLNQTLPFLPSIHNSKECHSYCVKHKCDTLNTDLDHYLTKDHVDLFSFYRNQFGVYRLFLSCQHCGVNIVNLSTCSRKYDHLLCKKLCISFPTSTVSAFCYECKKDHFNLNKSRSNNTNLNGKDLTENVHENENLSVSENVHADSID